MDERRRRSFVPSTRDDDDFFIGVVVAGELPDVPEAPAVAAIPIRSKCMMAREKKRTGAPVPSGSRARKQGQGQPGVHKSTR